jgi:hypothetical protein
MDKKIKKENNMKNFICILLGHKFISADIYNGNHCGRCKKNFRGIMPKGIIKLVLDKIKLIW